MIYITRRYDQWQLDNVFTVDDAGNLLPAFAKCNRQFQDCNATQLQLIQGYHDRYLKVLAPVLHPSAGGPRHSAFITSCNGHCQTDGSYWQINGVSIQGVTESEAVGHWLDDSEGAQSGARVMCPYPCKEAGSHCAGS